MPKGYNSLNNIKIDTFEIGICPVCSRRLTAECEHRTDESEAWYAAQILAEQELHNDTQPEPLPFVSLSDTVQVYIAPKVAVFMDAPEVAPWDEIPDGKTDWGEISENYRQSQPYHNDLYPYV